MAMSNSKIFEIFFLLETIQNDVKREKKQKKIFFRKFLGSILSHFLAQKWLGVAWEGLILG